MKEEKQQETLTLVGVLEDQDARIRKQIEEGKYSSAEKQAKAALEVTKKMVTAMEESLREGRGGERFWNITNNQLDASGPNEYSRYVFFRVLAITPEYAVRVGVIDLQGNSRWKILTPSDTSVEFYAGNSKWKTLFIQGLGSGTAYGFYRYWNPA